MPYRHYYAFKQLTTAQPPNSNMVERTVVSFPNSDVLVFRKKEEDTIYAHVSNFLNSTRSITLNVEGKVGHNYTIKSYTVRVTDGVSNDEMSTTTLFQNPPKSLTHSLTPYSVNTFKIVLTKDISSSIQNTVECNEIPYTCEKGVLDDFNIVQTGSDVHISSLSNQKIKSVMFHSILGQMNLNQTNIDSETTHFKVSNWTSGIYFFTIKTDKGSVVKKVFVGR